MPGCLVPTSLLRPANNLLKPLGSSVVGSFATGSADSGSAAGASVSVSCTASVGASVGSVFVVGFLRDISGLVRRTWTGALAAIF